MLQWLEFQNYRCLRDCRLPLDRLNLLVGPNGAGKSTVIAALGWLRQIFRGQSRGKVLLSGPHVPLIRTVGVEPGADVVIRGACGTAEGPFGLMLRITDSQRGEVVWGSLDDARLPNPELPGPEEIHALLRRFRAYKLFPDHLAQPASVDGRLDLDESGKNLAAVLDALRDQYPERFEKLNDALSQWLPEFDRIVFAVPPNGPGVKTIALRTRSGGHRITGVDLSDGTKLALALLTLAWLPEPPPIVAIEEPDRGIHPRLLEKVHDALVRLAFPEQYNEQRAPVQVIATTHSPYLLDLFRDHPEHVVIASKKGLEVTFARLSEQEDLLKQLDEGSPLGEIWHSGVLGGVP